MKERILLSKSKTWDFEKELHARGRSGQTVNIGSHAKKDRKVSGTLKEIPL